MGNPASGPAVSELRPLTDFEKDLVEKIDKFGCMIMHVFDGKGSDPGFSYSIGFPKNLGQPEVLVYGLDNSLMHSMINEIFRQCREDGLILQDGLHIGELIEGFDCIAREVSDCVAINEHFGSAIWYNRRFLEEEIQTAFQIVWPGARQGLFPWEQGCADDVIECQPALYTEGTVH